MSASSTSLRALLALGLALLTSAFARAAQAPARSEAEVRAYLTSGVVKLGSDRVSLIVAVENARTAEIRALPKVDGLATGPLPAPNEHRSITVFGNRKQESVSRTWPIPVRASDVGQYTIPPFEILVDGEVRRTTELTLNVVKDMKGEELGFLEIKSSSRKVIVGQPFSIELLFGFDAAIREQTNYGNLALSWWGNLPALLENELPNAAPGQRRVGISINDREQVEAEQLDNRTMRGREFIVLRVVRSFTPTRTGEIEIPTSFFEFGRVVERRDFFRTQREKAETFFARAPDLSISVVPLPEAGRPIDYSGAIGSLSVRADASPRDVDAGESIKLVVEWSGEGNLEFFTPPDPARLEAFRDFRVYGRTEEKAFDRRTVTYDLAPVTSRVTEIPPLPLSVYDAQAERYTVVSTAPIPIRVRALEGAHGLAPEQGAERFKSDIRDVVMRPGTRDEPAPLGAGVVLAALGALPVGWLALRGLVRRHFDPDAPAERARRAARRELTRRLARSSDARAQLDALHRFLAARSGETPEAWIGRRVQEGVRGADAARLKPLDELIAELERAVWGGGGGGVVERQRVLSAADEALRGGL